MVFVKSLDGDGVQSAIVSCMRRDHVVLRDLENRNRAECVAGDDMILVGAKARDLIVIVPA